MSRVSLKKTPAVAIQNVVASVNTVKATITPAIQKRCHEIFPPHRGDQQGQGDAHPMRWLTRW